MMFQQGIKGNLITLRERKTPYMVAIKNKNKTVTGTAFALISTVKELKRAIKSITFDQDSEFQKYEWIKECLKTDVYCCKPVSPEQKATVENGNGVICVEFPRNINIVEIQQKTVNKVVTGCQFSLRCYFFSRLEGVLIFRAQKKNIYWRFITSESLAEIEALSED